MTGRGFFVHIRMRLVLGGIAALSAVLAVGFVLPSVARHEGETGRQRASFEERFSLDGNFSFEERFLFERPSDSFGRRFDAVSTGSVPSVVRLASPQPKATCASISCRRAAPAPRLAAVTSPPPNRSAKKVQLASLEMWQGSSVSLDPESHTAIYDITARTVYMPDGRRLEAHSGLGDRMDDPRYFEVKEEGPTPPNVYDLSLRENLFHGVRALRMTPVGDGKMYGRAGILAHSYMLGPSGQSNGCVSFSDYPAFLNAFLRGEVTRLVVVERLAAPPSTQMASASFLKPLVDLFGGPVRATDAQPEHATGYAASGN